MAGGLARDPPVRAVRPMSGAGSALDDPDFTSNNDPRDADDFPWLRIVVRTGDLAAPIPGDLWSSLPSDRFQYERLDQQAAIAWQARPWDDQDVGALKAFAAGILRNVFNHPIDRSQWHFETVAGAHVDQRTRIWDAFEPGSDAYFVRHPARGPGA